MSFPSHPLILGTLSVTQKGLLLPGKIVSSFQAEHKNPSLAHREKRACFSHHTETLHFAHDLCNCPHWPFLATQLS